MLHCIGKAKDISRGMVAYCKYVMYALYLIIVCWPVCNWGRGCVAAGNACCHNSGSCKCCSFSFIAQNLPGFKPLGSGEHFMCDEDFIVNAI